MIEFLTQKGLAPDDAATITGSTPLEVALEYKRLAAARRLQQLRDASRKSTVTGKPLEDALHASESMPTPPPAQLREHSGGGATLKPPRTSSSCVAAQAEDGGSTRKRTRPPPRFPSWILSGSSIAELDGPGEANEAEACRLASRSVPFVWRRSGLCDAFPSAVEQLSALRSERLDTNVAHGADRKFAYFSPERLERGIYESSAIRAEFAPMRLNEQLPMGETLARQKQQAREGSVGGGDAPTEGNQTVTARSETATNAGRQGAVGRCGWRRCEELELSRAAPYVMHKLLESATANEVRPH